MLYCFTVLNNRYIQHLIGEDSRPGSSRGGRRGRGRGCGRGRGRPFNQRGRRQQLPNMKSYIEEVNNEVENDCSGNKDGEDAIGGNHSGILEAIFTDCTVAQSAGVESAEADGDASLPTEDQPIGEANLLIRDGSTEGETSSPRKRVRDDTCFSDTGGNKKRSKWSNRKQNKRNIKV